MSFFSRDRLMFSLIFGINLAGVFSSRAQLPTVPTPREPVTNTYHGVAVVDDYQWLENGTNPAVRAWTKAQNERTRAYFDKLDFRDGLEQQLSELVADQSASYNLNSYRRGIIFATRFKPPAQQPVLVRLKSVYPPALRKVVFDPNTWNTNGTTAMDWWVPSADGRLIAICLSEKEQRSWRAPFFRNRHRQCAARYHSRRSVSDGWRQCRLERGRHRHFLYALSARG